VGHARLHDYYRSLCEIATLPRLGNSTASKNISLTLAYIYINETALQAIPLQHYLQPLEPKNHQANSAQFCCYFEVLEYVASELDNSRLVVDEGSRKIARERAVEQQRAVLELLN
jgi:hypothetical protein